MTTPSIFHVGQRLTDGVNVDVTVERVAGGGMGEVAMGPDRMHEDSWRAIKALRHDLSTRSDPGIQRRLRASFLQEALIWRGLWPHPNLVIANYATEINGEPMLVLEYAERGSLDDMFATTRNRGGWLSQRYALSLAQQIAAGLVALHTPAPELLRAKPIIHRDLTPRNILFDQIGFAKITDFGLAKIVTEETQAHLAQQRGPVGTPPYIPPEQWQDASQAGKPADAYAFGLIVCELLTGRHPLLPPDQPHSQAEWQLAHLKGRPIPLSQLGARVFANERAQHDVAWGVRQAAALEQVEALVAQLLAKQEAARPSVEESLADLRAAAVTLGERPYTVLELFPPTEENLRIFWLGWAASYDRFGLDNEALPRIERALALAPKDPQVLTQYALILDGLGRLEEALVIHQQSLALIPKEDHKRRAIRLSNIGNCLTRLRRHAEAEAEVALAEATQLAPDYADAWINRAANAGAWAMAERSAGRVEAARTQVEAGLKYIAQAQRLNPDNPDCLQVKQELLQHRERLRGQG